MIRTRFRLASGSVALVGLAVWLFGGPNLGWTKTSITRMATEPVTGLQYPITEKTFNPGVDVMAAALLVSAILYGASFLTRKN